MPLKVIMVPWFLPFPVAPLAMLFTVWAYLLHTHCLMFLFITAPTASRPTDHNRMSNSPRQHKPLLSWSQIPVVMIWSWLIQEVFLRNVGSTWPGSKGDLGGSESLRQGTQLFREAIGSFLWEVHTWVETVEIQCRGPWMSEWRVCIQDMWRDRWAQGVCLTLQAYEYV